MGIWYLQIVDIYRFDMNKMSNQPFFRIRIIDRLWFISALQAKKQQMEKIEEIKDTKGSCVLGTHLKAPIAKKNFTKTV